MNSKEQRIIEPKITNGEVIPPEDQIQCIKISLHDCALSLLTEEQKNEPPIQFAIQPTVIGDNKMVSELKVCLINTKPEKPPFFGHRLTFTYFCYFKGEETTTKEKMGRFGQLYTLAILWPYVREFAQDIFSRTGLKAPVLPIINPTATTMEMLEQGVINVHYQEDSEKEIK
ncbi:MAG: hypothetical protein NTZ74_01200 [Chloroflexi bacterium]|nr:hypothetical protein [Chloroflexota bacterium]